MKVKVKVEDEVTYLWCHCGEKVVKGTILTHYARKHPYWRAGISFGKLKRGLN